jgi:ketosteroid isomerase-like protein
MSDANIKTIQDIYAAFGRRDIPTVLEALAPDVSWGIVGREADVPFAGVRQGKAGAGEFFRLLAETQEISRFEPQKFMAAGDTVFAWGRYDWTMRRSGVAGVSEWLHVFTIRDGKVVAWRGHQDTAMLADAYHAAPAGKRAAAG